MKLPVARRRGRFERLREQAASAPERIELPEFQPTMLQAKSMVVDGA